jgi:hypothetical protein
MDHTFPVKLFVFHTVHLLRWSYLLVDTNKYTNAKMFSCSLLFITPTCFGHSCDIFRVSHSKTTSHMIFIR